MEYVSTKEAKKILNLCTKTLQNYDNLGKIKTIRTPGNRRLYNVQKYLEENNLVDKSTTKKNVIYCRVSSSDRKDDLERQISILSSLYPDYEVLSDIGSGINFKRKGLLKLVDYAINNNLNEVVITYKDRLCRIGYDLLESIFTKYSKASITILNVNNDNKSEEITKDLIEIITVYSSKIHEQRRNNI